MLATLTVDGMGPSLVLPGAMDRRVLDRFVTEVLVPTLGLGRIVVLDNLSVHRRARAEACLAEAGCALWFLRRYSPDRTLIEQAFAKLKGGVRRAGARTFEAGVEAVRAGYQTITTRDAAGFIRAAGFSP